MFFAPLTSVWPFNKSKIQFIRRCPNSNEAKTYERIRKRSDINDKIHLATEACKRHKKNDYAEDKDGDDDAENKNDKYAAGKRKRIDDTSENSTIIKRQRSIDADSDSANFDDHTFLEEYTNKGYSNDVMTVALSRKPMINLSKSDRFVIITLIITISPNTNYF